MSMNEFQEALDRVKEDYEDTCSLGMRPMFSYDDIYKMQKLVDRATPKRPVKLEIYESDEVIMPKYTTSIGKYMCEDCGLTWFIVDEHVWQNKFCNQCGQAIDWEWL